MSLSEIRPQVLLLAAALMLGFLTGFLFDIYRRIRNIVSPGPYLTALGDLSFWGIITAVTFYSLFKINYAEVRGYLFLGLALGLFLYLTFLSGLVIKTFVLFDIFARNNTRRVLQCGKRVKRFRIFALTERVFKDARRIYFKIKKK